MRWLWLIAASWFLVSCASAHSSDSSAQEITHHHEDGGEDSLHEHHEAETITSMAASHAQMGPHFRWTALRPVQPADEQRAALLLQHLRAALAPYRDYHRAIKDGYEPFLPYVVQPHYHFTSKWRGVKAAFRFNPAEPTSFLYRKTSDGYELEGAMYTAPKRMTEGDLDDRIPLSVAQWHAHVNICLPPKRDAKAADWTKFGPKGAILTEKDCDQVKGRFVLQLFGWMVHVYPYADSPEKIWTH